MENYIGENIRYYRERLGISQAELARRLGKTGSAVSQYEAGINVPRVQVVERMADVLGCRVSDIMEPAAVHLLDGVTVNCSLSLDELAFLETFRSMPQEKREQLFRIAGTL